MPHRDALRAAIRVNDQRLIELPIVKRLSERFQHQLRARCGVRPLADDMAQRHIDH